MKKRILTGLLVLIMAFCLSACSSKEKDTADISQAEETSLPENGDTITYILEARMVSDYNSDPAFHAEDTATAATFWETLAYLVSDYGTQNEAVTLDEGTGAFSVSKKELQYYGASLYAELGKVKKLPELSGNVSAVTKISGKKYQVDRMTTDEFSVNVAACYKDSTGTYTVYAALINSSGTEVQEYKAAIKESAYGTKKTSFPYTVVSLARLTEHEAEDILVGERETAFADVKKDASGGDGQNASQEGDASGNLAADGTETTGAAGAISSGSALEQAQNYYGTKDPDSGEDYVYTYDGVTTFNQASYYSFSVSVGETYVINILVSDDGSRILKGIKNADGTLDIQ